ncbi:MAG TPA: hypothetical protein VG778_01745 [Blastocatellia bacterium]|nr:hypothetical protein [Blastocatellia bacterium]
MKPTIESSPLLLSYRPIVAAEGASFSGLVKGTMRRLIQGPRSWMRRRTALLSIVMAFVVVFLSPGLKAQDAIPEGAGIFRSDTLEMAVKAGFAKLEVRTWTGSWSPFRITVTNNGESISGRLVVRTQFSSGTNPAYRDFVKDVQLPSGSHQTHEIAAFLNTDNDVEVLLTSKDRTLARATLPLETRSFRSRELDIAVVDTDTITLNNLTATEISRPANRELFSRQPRADASDDDQGRMAPYRGYAGRGGTRWSQPQAPTARPFVISAEDLPRDFISYDQLDAVVLGDAPLSQLHEEQVRALRLWVASGGLLIVTGAADVAGLRQTGLDAIMPADTHGSVTVSSLPELTAVYNPFESADPPLLMTAHTRADATTLLGAKNQALVAERYYGRGLVRFLAINPKINPYRGWGAAKDLWNDLLVPAAEARNRNTSWIAAGQFPSRQSNRWGVQNFLFDLAQIEPFSAKYFLIFLLLYVAVVGPVNYAILRWKKKTELAWITIPATVLVFTAVSVTVARVSRGTDPVAADVSLVEINQRDGISRVTGGMLVMPSSKGTHELSFAGNSVYVCDLVGAGQGSNSVTDDFEIQRTDSRLMIRVPMNTWTARIFQIKSVSDGASLLALSDEANTPGSTRVNLKNLSDSAITDAAYVSANGVSDLFSLEPGETKTIALAAPRGGALATWYRAQLRDGSQEAAVFDDLEDVLDGEVGAGKAFNRGFFNKPSMTEAVALLERPMVIAFRDVAPTKVTFSSSLRQKSKALYIVHL